MDEIMEENKISVLFMDDESSNLIVQDTLKRMENEGFKVTFTHTINEAIELYYKSWFDVFILDIDMTKNEVGEESDGVAVLKRFISLHNNTKVIMFSGAGMEKEWLESANTHCFAYVAKDQSDIHNDLTSIDLLIKKIRESVESRGKQRVSVLSKIDIPKEVAIYCDEEHKFKLQDILETVLDTEWNLNWFSKLKEMDNFLDANRTGLALLFKHQFSTRESTFNYLSSILSKCPYPNVIVGLDAKKENRPSILHIVNSHPFRIVNILEEWENELKDIIGNSLKWYGKTEIFSVTHDILKRLDISLSDDIMKQWEFDYLDEEDEETLYLYDYLEQESKDNDSGEGDENE